MPLRILALGDIVGRPGRQIVHQKLPGIVREKHVDLVVANPSFLDTFESASADTPKVIYSNVSNIYEDMLADWLANADATGADREANVRGSKTS